MVLLAPKDKRELLDPRVKLAMLPLLSVAHATNSHRIVLPLVLFTALICVLYRDSLRRGAWIVAFTAVALTMFALVVRLSGYSVPITELVTGYVRLLSLSTVSVVLVLSMNSMEVITSLSYFRVPIGIALAVGVGLRFLPVFAEEAKRVRIRQRRLRGMEIVGNGNSFGFMARLDQTISPFVVSVLRRVDLLLLSIAVQQLQSRIKAYAHSKLAFTDWIALLASGSLLIASLAL